MDQVQRAVWIAVERITRKQGITLSPALHDEVARHGASYVNLDIERYCGVEEAARLALTLIVALRVGPVDHPSVQRRRAG